MALLKSVLHIIIGGGVTYVLFRVVSPNEEDLVKYLNQEHNYQKVDRKHQEQLIKILKRAANIVEPMSKQDQGDASSTNSKLKSDTFKTEK